MRFGMEQLGVKGGYIFKEHDIVETTQNSRVMLASEKLKIQVGSGIE